MPPCDEGVEDVCEKDVIIAFLEDQSSTAVQEIKEATACDEELTTLKQHLLCVFPELVKQCPSFIGPYFQFCCDLSEIDGVILRGQLMELLHHHDMPSLWLTTGQSGLS